MNKKDDVREITLIDNFKLLRELIEYICKIYQGSGIGALLEITDPSIDDLLNVLTELENQLDVTHLNAQQAILLTKLLLKEIQREANQDDEHKADFDSQFSRLLQSLTFLDKEEKNR
ncbi:hypothetical protein [Neisseria subflava]|jgi:hypothetical protein|uniref:hypothetical protein n=1 Tax=Neisseria subflava TaxID=28449 RepID=UPI000E0D639D|nr:hypothetical protein [Neisseria subflava]